MYSVSIGVLVVSRTLSDTSNINPQNDRLMIPVVENLKVVISFLLLEPFEEETRLLSLRNQAW